MLMKKRFLSMLVLLMTVVTGVWAQTGMTNGLFSVSATKRVYFSKGNLQLVGENTFQFAENQWDYFGSNQSDNHRDLFCWGTGNNPNQTTGNSTFTDWGDNTYLQATLGKGWRTMTKDEFVYVFNTRASGSSVFGNANGRYTTATINTDGTGVNGFILFPDGITIAASEVTTAGTINSNGTVTQCTTAQWAALAEKGCVFLPAAGYFLTTGGAGYGSINDYWSSTAANASKAYNLNFNFGVGGVNIASSLAYKYGCSVRLVNDRYDPNHQHNFSYKADGATITATCTEGCDIFDPMTLTISAPKNLLFNYQKKEATLNADYNKTAFPGEIAIDYYQGTTKLNGAPFHTGNYSAKVTIGGQTASVDFTINGQTPIRFIKKAKLGNNYIYQVKTLTEYLPVESTNDYCIMLDGRTYIVKGNVVLSKGLIYKGAVNLIVCDKAKLTIKGGIWHIGSQLDIYAEEGAEQTATIDVQGDTSIELEGVANQPVLSGNIVLNSGNFTAVPAAEGKLAADDLELTIANGVNSDALTGGTLQDDGSTKFTSAQVNNLTSLSLSTPPSNSVKLAKDTEDVDNWTVSDGTSVAKGTATLPNVAAGTTVTATYSGTKKVIGVKVKKGGVAALIYSWESPDGTVSQTGGTIAYANGDGNRLNYYQAGYHTICLNGKKGNLGDESASANSGRMDVTLDEALAAGDVISITAFINKNESKQSSAYIVFNGANGFNKNNMGVNAESNVFGNDANVDGTFNGSPQTVTVTVPAEAAGCKSFSMTRGVTGTNLFITKLEITKGN